MTAFISFLLMFPAGAMHGGNFGKWKWWRYISLIIFAVDFGLGAIAITHSLWASPLGIISALAFSLGHGNFFAMRGVNPANDNPEYIETYGGRWLWESITDKASITQPAYSWFMMGLKWLLVASPILPFAPVFALFAPAAYFFSFRYTKSSTLAEWLTTIFSGLLIMLICL